MKKYFGGMSIYFVFGLLFMACGSNPTSTPAAPVAPAPVVERTFETISIGGTSWKIDNPIDIRYVFNNDDSFKLALPSELVAFNDASWQADTEGTYTIDGNEVTLNFPNGRAINFSKAASGGIDLSIKEIDSQSFLIGEDLFYIGGVLFRLIK